MYKTFGETIASLRRAHGMRQQTLADALAEAGVPVSNQAVSKWENDATLPNAQQFLTLCRVLDVDDIAGTFSGGDAGGLLAGLNAEGRRRALEYIALLRESKRFAAAPDDTERFLRIYYKFGAMISREAALAACAESARTHAPVLACLLAQGDLSDTCREAVEQLRARLDALPQTSGEALIRTIWGPMGYSRFVTERRLDPGNFSILCMLAAPQPSAAAFLARLDALRQLIRTHRDAPDARLMLSTIHGSKGLEYDRVFLLDVHDGVLPAVPNGSDGTEDAQRAYEEDRRLFYVAMTRAKNELYLFDYPDVPSAFVRELRQQLPKPFRPAEDFASILPENACGLRYRHAVHGEGQILAHCGDAMLVAFADGDRCLQAGQMLLERDRTPDARTAPPSAQPLPPAAAACGPGSEIWHRKYGRGRIVSLQGTLAAIRFEAPGETAPRTFCLPAALQNGFLSFKTDAPG